MKKAGIITIFGEYNFGNRVQNYAVQEVLKKFNLDVYTIKNLSIYSTMASEKTQKDRQRIAKFREFNENIKFEKETIYKEYEVPENIKNDYDYFVMGSDQLWNYTYKTSFSKNSMASFAKKEQKISFAASMGVSNPPEKDDPIYGVVKKYLEDIKYLSVREDAAKSIIKQMTGRDDVEVLLDPTMMLSANEWEKVMKKPEKLRK